VVVGAETLDRGVFTGPQLLKQMQAVNSTLKGQFKIGTSDNWSAFANGTADAVIQGQPDILYVHRIRPT